MPLQKILVDIPLGQGINQSTDPMLLPPGELTEAVNVRYDKLGRTSKRYGFSRIGTSQVIGLLNDGSTCFSVTAYTPSVQIQDIAMEPYSNGVSGMVVDSDRSGDFSFAVFQPNSSGFFVESSIGDISCGSSNFSQSVVPFGVRADSSKNLGIGVVPIHDQTSGSFSARIFYNLLNSNGSVSSGAGTVGTTIARVNSRWFLMDSCVNVYVNASGTPFYDCYVASRNGAHTLNIHVTANASFLSMSSGGDVNRSFTTTSRAEALACCVDRVDRALFVSWVDAQGVKLARFNHGTTAAAFSVTISSSVTSGMLSSDVPSPMTVAIDATYNGYIAVTDTSTSAVLDLTYCFVFDPTDGSGAAGIGSIARSIVNNKLCPSFNVFNDNEVFFGTVDRMAQTLNMFEVGDQRFRNSGIFNPGNIASVVDSNCAAPYGFSLSAYSTTLGEYKQPGTVFGAGANTFAEYDDLASSPVNATVTTSLLSTPIFGDFAYRGLASSQLGDTTLVCGGEMSAVNGRLIYSVGPTWAPEFVASSNTTSTPSGLFLTFSGEGSYLLYPVAESYGMNGRRSLSYPGTAMSVSIGSVTTYVQVAVRVPQFDGNLPVRTLLYSTDANETEPYLVAWNVAAPSSTSVGFSGEVISGSDDLRTSEILYTVGEPENYWPGAVSAIAADSNRVYVVPGHNRYVVLPSKPLEGNRACAFYPGVERAVPARGGPCTALARLDGKLFAFKQTSVFVAQGDGPDATGANDNLSEFDALPDRCGAYNQRSVLVTPFGVVCVGPAGIYLIDRALQSVHIGEKVQDDIIGQKFSISSMVYRPDTEDMLIIFDNYGDKTTSSYSLQYNFKAQAWSHVQNMIGIGAAVSDTAFVGSANITDTVSNEGSLNFYFAPSPGATAAYTAGVFQESYGAYTDNQAITANRTYYQTFETGWIKTDSLQRANRVYRAILSGSANTSVTFNAQVKVAFDFESSWNETHTISVNAATTGSTPFEFEVPFQRQKCKSFKLQVSETGASEGLAGYTLTGLSVEIGVKQSALGLRSEKKSP